MDDIVTLLRDIAALRGNMSGSVIPVACTEAADEIERLRADLENVRDLNEHLTQELQSYYNEDEGIRGEEVVTDDIVTRLRDTVFRLRRNRENESANWKLYEHLLSQSIDKIERLEQENADILATIPTIIRGVQNGMAEKIETLRSEIEDWKRTVRTYEQMHPNY